MDELTELLRPAWGAEKWILEGWDKINAEEKNLIKSRMHALFKNGLPFELQQDKLFYLYTFSLLAQLEVLAIQIPLKFEEKMSLPEHKKLMRVQLLDEIFHGLVFTKIVYLLSAPYASPPPYNAEIEILCNFIRSEECPKIGLVLLNFIGEAWIEEIFYSLQQAKIAPKVFSAILEDERRHVCEADLYREIGIPNEEVIRSKLHYLEEQLLTNIFSQYKYMTSVVSLLGIEGATHFIQSLHKKHLTQLDKLGLSPSTQWNSFMQMQEQFLPQMQSYLHHTEVEMTPIRKALMTQWDNPCDPTMAGEFNVNVSSLDFFAKKYPPETLTTLMLQAISQGLMQAETFRYFLNHKKLWLSQKAYVGVVVKLPECRDHIGTIVFEDCHLWSVQALATKIRNVVQQMVWCYQKREALEQEFPAFKDAFDEALEDMFYGVYPYPMPMSPVVTVSNIGFCGYTHAKSPLRINEGLRFTLLEVGRKLVWNKSSNQFEAQDLLPVSISADHRIFDGNLPIPTLIQTLFDEKLAHMHVYADDFLPSPTYEQIIPQLEQLLVNNKPLAYKMLLVLQTLWLASEKNINFSLRS